MVRGVGSRLSFIFLSRVACHPPTEFLCYVLNKITPQRTITRPNPRGTDLEIAKDEKRLVTSLSMDIIGQFFSINKVFQR